MRIKAIDPEKLEFEIGRGNKRRSKVKVKIMEIDHNINSCTLCALRSICHNNPICSDLVSSAVSSGYLLPNIQHVTIYQP